MKVFLCCAVSFFSCWCCCAETYNVFEENGKVGLKDQQGQVVIPAAYEALGWSDGSVSVIERVTGYKRNGMWGLIGLDNKHITKAAFSGLVAGEGNILIAIKRSHLSQRFVTGCIDTAGKEIIPFQYENAIINDLRVIVSVKSSHQYNYGLLDLSNKVIIPIQFRSLEHVGSLRYAVENFDAKYALYSESGEQLTGFLFNAIRPFKKNHAIITRNERQGIINRDGTILAEPVYKQIIFNDDGLAAKAKPADEWLILDGQNKELQKKVEADSIVSLNNNLFKLYNGAFVQLVNAQLAPISSNQFTAIEPFVNNKAIFKRGKKEGLLSSNGSILIESLYDKLVPQKNYVVAINDNKWILLDSTGNRKTSKTYDSIGNFNGPLCPVKNRAHYGAVDRTGKEVVSCVYDSICQLVGELLVVKFHNTYGILDLKENWIVGPQPYPIMLISSDRYLQYQEKTIFLRSLSGGIIYFTENKIETGPDYLIEYISSGGLWKINLDGRIVNRQMPPEEPYEFIFEASEGLRGIKKDDRYGFIDDQGRLRIANRYEDIKPFKERMAAVKLLNKWGFVDHDEKLVIQPVFEQVTPFHNGISMVLQKGLYGLINKKGTLVLPARYKTITLLPTNRFLLFSDGLFGLADTDGRLITVPKYGYIHDPNTGYLVIAQDGRYGLITTEGISTIPMINDYISCDAFNSRYFVLKRTAWKELALTTGSKP